MFIMTLVDPKTDPLLKFEDIYRNFFIVIVNIAFYFSAGREAAGSRDENGFTAGHKSAHNKKRCHEDRGINSQQPQYQARTSDAPG